jgi:tripartite-type tricarboxylate transporter receptor subunit TctC
LLQKVIGAEFVHVPYKGTGPAINDLLGGHVDFMFDSVPSALPHVQAKKLRALALTGPHRSALMPESATFDELGYPGRFRAGWGGVFAPGGVPPPVLAKLQDAIRLSVNEPALVARLESAGVGSVYLGSADFHRFVHEENDYWGSIIKASGIKI